MAELTAPDFWISRTTAFNACSAFVVLGWDWLLCLDKEIAWVSFFGLQMDVLCLPSIGSICTSSTEWNSTHHFKFPRVGLLLMIRVYLLWDRNRRILLVFALFLVLEVSCLVVGSSILEPDTYFNQLCLFKKLPELAFVFSTAVLSIQIAIIALMLYKHHLLPRPHRGLSSLVTLIREGSLVSLMVFVLLLAGLVYISLDTEYGASPQLDIVGAFNIRKHPISNLLLMNNDSFDVQGCRLTLGVPYFSADNSHHSSYDDSGACFTSIGFVEQDPEVSFAS
ncbi:hypothetical protein BU15DRAFT_82575 [Melanogaster broomeanus]|nr:hypothetical protein BU15DRAFT_82575 [Melanogaster broomeanus]